MKVNTNFTVTKNFKKPSLPRGPKLPRSKRLIIAAIVGIVLVGSFSVFYFISNNNRIESVVKNGQSVQGAPTGHISQVAYKDDDRTKYRYYVQYAYEVNGETYRVNGQSYTTVQARAKARRDANAIVTVYYMPDNPAQGIIKD